MRKGFLCSVRMYASVDMAFETPSLLSPLHRTCSWASSNLPQLRVFLLRSPGGGLGHPLPTQTFFLPSCHFCHVSRHPRQGENHGAGSGIETEPCGSPLQTPPSRLSRRKGAAIQAGPNTLMFLAGVQSLGTGLGPWSLDPALSIFLVTLVCRGGDGV